MNPVLIGWSIDEAEVLLSFKGMQVWCPVERADGEEYGFVRVGATRYRIGACSVTPA